MVPEAKPNQRPDAVAGATPPLIFMLWTEEKKIKHDRHNQKTGYKSTNAEETLMTPQSCAPSGSVSV